jgi:hypothetical protein
MNGSSVILLFREDVWDVLFGFSLLANDPRVKVWATYMLFKECTNNKNYVIRQATNHVLWS